MIRDNLDADPYAVGCRIATRVLASDVGARIKAKCALPLVEDLEQRIAAEVRDVLILERERYNREDRP